MTEVETAYQQGLNDGYSLATAGEVLEIQQIKELERQQAREEVEHGMSEVRS